MENPNKSNILLKMLLDYSNDIVIVLTDNNLILEFNKKAEIYYERKRHMVLGKNYANLKSFNKEIINFQKLNTSIRKVLHINTKNIKWSVIHLNHYNDLNSAYLTIGKEQLNIPPSPKKLQHYLEDMSTIMPGNFYWKDKEGLHCWQFVSHYRNQKQSIFT